ncbi:MAG: protein kinase [Candidatus Sulfopaludibacter sp.]|nr:protein kinase [Candidatus Sulfopaludibacter sp.]
MPETVGSLFAPGQLVAGRFRIVRELGRGGMGAVYQAIDEKLVRTVALKTAQPGHGHRLPPETRAAREVSHFNVCKVHDLHSVETPQGEIEFLSMEFIEGETLFARIRTHGALPPDQVRDLALQLCAGLAQAHRQGVIHGDLKPANVILSKTPEGAFRAVITDFGLARFHPAGEEFPAHSGAAGTYDYMAPELFHGAPPSVASDLYALGVVFHQMLTGGAARWEDTPPEVASHDSTLTLKQVRPGPQQARRCAKLPKPWNGVVAKCLAPLPADRFESADEVAGRLLPRRLLRRWAPAAVVLAVALGALAVWPGRNAETPVRLAVLPVTVHGAPVPTSDGLGLDIADRLSGLRHAFTAIPPAEAVRAKVETPQQAKAALGATHALKIDLSNSGAQVTVDSAIVDAATGDVLGRFHHVYAPREVSVLAKALTATVTGAFHLRAPPETVSADAYSSYIQGINLLRRDLLSADEAIPFLEEAIRRDPTAADPYAALAEAQMQKSQRGGGPAYLDSAGQNVAKAESLNPDSVKVLLAAGLYRRERGQYEEAIQAWQRAAELSPNSAAPRDRLAGLYTRMGRADDAVSAFRQAIAAEPEYYLPYLDFGLFYLSRAQYKESEEMFRHVTVLMPGLSSGHMDLGLALMEEGRLQEAEKALLDARGIRQDSRVLVNLGALYYQEQRYAEAAALFGQAAAGEPSNATILEDLGDAYRYLGRTAEMRLAYRKALDLESAALGRNPRDGVAHARLAFVLAELGDRNRASFEMAQALALSGSDQDVIVDAALTYEALGQRDKTLAVLAVAPWRLLRALTQQPDAKSLMKDPRFQQLLAKRPGQ